MFIGINTDMFTMPESTPLKKTTPYIFKADSREMCTIPNSLSLVVRRMPANLSKFLLYHQRLSAKEEPVRTWNDSAELRGGAFMT